MKAHSVSAVVNYIKGIFQSDAELRNIAVVGELSNYKKYPSGHCYFTLKDANAALKCVMFKTAASRLRFLPQNGMQVILSGNVSIYEKDGNCQLYVERMQPDGVGDLAYAFEQLKKRLEAEGLFAAVHKKKLPFFAKKIGVVTSPAGAVIRDIYKVAKQRNPYVELTLYPVQVQGEGAATQIARGIEVLDALGFDLLIVGRGGGSMEDLWAFNEEAVVRAIYAAKTPVISAVGHETDITLADFVADERAATPSHAAARAVLDRRACEMAIVEQMNRLRAVALRSLEIYKGRVKNVTESRAYRTPARLLDLQKQYLDKLQIQLSKGYEAGFSEKSKRVSNALSRLEILGPINVLRRGYAIAENGRGIVRSVREISAGEMLKLRLSDGVCLAEVQTIEEI